MTVINTRQRSRSLPTNEQINHTFLNMMEPRVVHDIEDQSVSDTICNGYGYPKLYVLVQNASTSSIELWYYDLLHGGGFWSKL